jgi:hypothetical protein
MPKLSHTAVMSDHSYIVTSSVILSAAKDLTNAAFLTLQKDADRDSNPEVPHFVRDDPQLNTTQCTLHEQV